MDHFDISLQQSGLIVKGEDGFNVDNELVYHLIRLDVSLLNMIFISANEDYGDVTGNAHHWQRE